ncbi:MAG TPA: cytochrome c biogenesis protein CcsA, partial [Thermoanaerobaculia bacterium]|nr:cytochrome c biogenesis protein CcsA [Thermoanaerobaculia bacterium]
SKQGTVAAQRLVYYAPWFLLLLGLLAVNTLAALVTRFPTNRWRVGFLVTHGGMAVILVGSFLTWDLGINGDLALWEGQQSQQFVERTRQGEVGRILPFAVRLDSFEIDTYQGTRRPAMFRSRVTVVDPRLATPVPAIIEMNAPLHYGGFSFFQSSYQIAPDGREMSILSVAQDPGQPVVFVGYFLLVGGMIIVLATRVAQRRMLARRAEEGAARRGEAREARQAAARVAQHPAAGGAPPAGAMGKKRKTSGSRARRAGLLVPFLLAGAAQAWAAAPLADAAAAERLRTLPVQHDGRVMPFDTLARDVVFKVTGAKGAWNDTDAVTLVLGWALEPQAWADEPVVKVGSDEVAALAGLPAGTSHASYRALLMPEAMRSAITAARAAAANDQALTSLQEDLREVEDRLLWLQSAFDRAILRAVPVVADPQAQWGAPPTGLDGAGLLAWLDAQAAQGAAPAAAMAREVTYNQVRPTQVAWWILVPATFFAILSVRRPGRLVDLLAVGGLIAGFAVMTWGIAVRWQVAERIPASNMYESMLFLGWGVGFFALIAAAILRNRLVILNATAMAALTMALVDLLPMDPFVHPVQPVLANTAWLAIHVPIIMVSYAVLALGVVIAHMQIGLEIFRPARREAAERMNDLLYWYIQVGSILLITGILTGSIWAASSWGRYWGWDPKEVWSLVAFLAYMAILHARFDRFLGPFGVAAASILAFWTVLMTYIGVNYVLAAGLHSYGFGGGGVVQWMALIAALEALFFGLGFAAYRRNRQGMAPVPAAA